MKRKEKKNPSVNMCKLIEIVQTAKIKPMIEKWGFLLKISLVTLKKFKNFYGFVHIY